MRCIDRETVSTRRGQSKYLFQSKICSGPFSSILILSFICASCLAANNGKRVVIDDRQAVLGVEMRNGAIAESDYEHKELLGKYVVLRSQKGVERVVLVETINLKEVVPFGLWSNVEKVDSDHLHELLQILEKLARREVPIDIEKPLVEAGRSQDIFSVDIPKSARKRFDAHAAAEKCVARFEAGCLPRRVFKKEEAYVFDCVLPGMEDSGYLIFVRRHHDGFHVIQAEPYQYDRIPKDNE